MEFSAQMMCVPNVCLNKPNKFSDVTIGIIIAKTLIFLLIKYYWLHFFFWLLHETFEYNRLILIAKQKKSGQA